MSFAAAVGKVNISGLLDGEVFPCCDVLHSRMLWGISAEDSVLVIGKGAQLGSEPIKVLAAVVSSDEGFDAELLRGNSVITCGLSGRNTVSVTSKTADTITLSLNRSITTLRGLCEPLELPVPLSAEFGDYDYMAAFAVSLLMGSIGQ